MLQFSEKQLPNGLQIITAPDKDSPSFTLLFSVLAGSRFETDGKEGLAHFLEHLAFKGSSKYPNQLAVAQEVEGFGGEWNAFTSNQRIAYYIRAAASNFEKAFEVLEDIVFKPLLIKEEIEKERGVILEELKLYYDDPKSWVEIKNEELTFFGHPLGKDVAGNPQSVKSLTREDFLAYRDKYFIAPRFAIGAAGNFEQGKLDSLVEKYIAKLDKTPDTPLNTFSPNQKEPQFYFEKRDTQQANLMLSFLGKSASDNARFAAGILGFILGIGLSSRLFQEVRTKRGLAYAVSAHHEPLADTGRFAIYAGVLKDKADEALEAILGELNKIKKEAVPEEELAKAKNHAKGLMALSLESSEDLINSLVSQKMITGSILTYEQQCALIDALTPSDIANIANEIFNSATSSLSVVGLPEDEKIKGLLQGF